MFCLCIQHRPSLVLAPECRPRAGAAEKRIDELIRRFCSEIEHTDALFRSLEKQGALRGMLEHSLPRSAASSGSFHFLPLRDQCSHVSEQLFTFGFSASLPLAFLLMLPALAVHHSRIIPVAKVKVKRGKRDSSVRSGLSSFLVPPPTIRPENGQVLSIVPPELGDLGTEDGDDDVRPLSRHEIGVAMKLHT